MLHFLKTGEFGEIRLGMSRQQVLDILGEPVWFGGYWPSQPVGDEVSPFANECPEWSYGTIAFFWGEKSDRLYMIYSDDMDRICLIDEKIEYDLWIFGEFRPPNKEQCESALQEAGIPYTIEVDKSGLGSMFVLPSGVILQYDNKWEHKDEVGILKYLDYTYGPV